MVESLQKIAIDNIVGYFRNNTIRSLNVDKVAIPELSEKIFALLDKEVEGKFELELAHCVIETLEFTEVWIKNRSFNEHFCNIIQNQKLKSLKFKGLEPLIYGTQNEPLNRIVDGEEKLYHELMPSFRRLISTESQQTLLNLSIINADFKHYEKGWLRNLISFLPNLRSLNLSMSHLDCSEFNVPSNLLDNFILLNLDRAQIMDINRREKSLDYISNFRNLQFLDLYDCQLSERDALSVCSLKYLLVLNIDVESRGNDSGSQNLKTYLKSNLPIEKLQLITFGNNDIDVMAFEKVLRDHSNLKEISLINTNLQKMEKPIMEIRRINVYTLSNIEDCIESFRKTLETFSTRQKTNLSVIISEIWSMIENENIPLRKNDRWSLFSLLIRFVTETKPGMNLVQPFKLLEKVVTDIPIQQWEHRDRHLLFTTIFHVLEKITNFKFRTPWLMREAVPSVWNIFGIFIHRDESEENSFQICKFSVDILAPIFVVRGRAFSKCINVLNSHLRKLSPDGIVRIVKNSHFDKYLAEHLETELTLVSNHDLGIIASMFVDTALLSLDEFLVSHYKIRVLHYLLRAASQRSDAEFQCHVLKSVSIIVSLTWTLVAIRKFWNTSCIGIQYVLSLLDSTHESILENAVRLLLTVKTAWEGSKIRDSHLLNRIQDERWSRLFENIPDQAKTIAQVVQQSQQYEGRRRHGNYRILQRMHTRCERREARKLVSWFLIDPSLRRFEMEGYLNYSRL